jgi:predicted dehydrogenase
MRTPLAAATRRPRLGFVGVGWIGTHRMHAVASSGLADIVVIADQSSTAADEALKHVAESASSARVASYAELLESELDGVVIATPNAEHPAQAHAALNSGHAVFCQKPIARTYAEARSIVDAARVSDRLLAVDYCYRAVAGVPELRTLVRDGSIGEVFAVNLIFHNAYGPDKPWFYDVRQAGGGCVIDLGIHLIDLMLWALDYPGVGEVRSRLYRQGALLQASPAEAEDYADIQLQLATGATAHLECSWNLSAGCDAVIEASFFGTRGAVRLRNVQGSFYDFRVDQCEKTRSWQLGTPNRTWGGVSICDWVRKLALSPRFDAAAERDIEAHRVLDAIYGRCAS